MRVINIVGNRPQFIKLAPVSRELRKRGIEEIIIHTGQHYDENMSDIFFEELGIPKPTKNLGVGSGTHAQVTAKAMVAIEDVLNEYKPDVVVVYGDTNTTLAAALVTRKMGIKLLHVEAGVRTGNHDNPEEINRVIVDRISDVLCTPDRMSVDNLLREGVQSERVHFIGDVMYDEFLYCAKKQGGASDIIDKFKDGYMLLTWHRQEDTCSKERMSKILDFIEGIDYPIVFPIHPRTKNCLEKFGLKERLESMNHIHTIPPVGYMEMVQLLTNCRLLISDSGGVSKESSYVQKKCLFLMDLKLWPELMESGNIYIIDFDDAESVSEAKRIASHAIAEPICMDKVDFFGNGDAAVKLVDIISAL